MPVQVLLDDGAALTSQRKQLLSVSKAARLMRASTAALNAWLAAGWMNDHGTLSGRRIVDLREALLIAGLRNGPRCIPDELARIDRRRPRAAAAPDPCLQSVRKWTRTLGALPEESLTRAITRLHQSGYTCAEITTAVARLSLGPPPARRRRGV
jgi:hypothetical protein